MSDDLLCHRCGTVLRPGRGNFYVIRIEAFADPSPPVIEAQDLRGDIPAAIDAMIEDLRDRSPRELADEVHRRITIHLCRTCYRPWIEDPAGQTG